MTTLGSAYVMGSSFKYPRIKHTVLGYSDDCELLEIVLPADFKTITLDK